MISIFKKTDIVDSPSEQDSQPEVKKKLKGYTKKLRLTYNDGLSRTTLYTILFLLLVNFFSSCSVLMRGDGKNDYAYVQTSDGSVVSGKRVHGLHREDATVEEFSKEWAVLMLSWKGQDDKGLVAFREKVPTNFFKMSWALAPTIRSSVAQRWMKAFETSKYVNSSKNSTIYRLTGVPQVQKIEEGKWSVKLYGARIIRDKGVQVEVDPYSMELLFHAVTPQPNPLGEEATSLDQIIAEMQATGLMIYDVREIAQHG